MTTIEQLPGQRASVWHESAATPIPESDLVERADEVADLMANGFARMHPELAAKAGFRRWQVWSSIVLAALLTAAAVLTPRLLAVLLAAATTSISLVILWVSFRGRSGADPAPDDIASTSSTLGRAAAEDLPSYTVLVPAYQEEAVIGDAVRCLSALD